MHYRTSLSLEQCEIRVSKCVGSAAWEVLGSSRGRSKDKHCPRPALLFSVT
jgi:hypothetical protein